MVKKANIESINILVKLAIELWPNHDNNELVEEFSHLVNNDNVAFFIKYLDNEPIGFAQCQLRYDYVEGTNSSPVGYLEGIYVKEKYRKHGYAKMLLEECEKWSKKKGCTEFASDCEIDNVDSLAFHMAMGFEESNRIICFNKKI